MKPGYKQTEVGVIPEDWEVCHLSSLVASGPKNGYSGRSGKDARGTPTLSLTATSSGYIILDEETVKHLEETIDRHSDILLKSGDVLVQRSNTPELVGTTAIFNGPNGMYAYPDLMIRLRFKSPETSHWFWRYANSSNGRRYFVSVAAGSTGTMPKISGDKLRNMPLPLPKLPEQRAIATALSDVDALLAALDRLIAKKRDLKQAAMQQLLTGQTRLPGFTGEWEVKRLGDVVQIQKGQLITSSTLMLGDVPVIAGGKQPAYYHAVANRYGRTITISASGASAGYVALYNKPIFASDCTTISEADNYSLDFIYFKLLSMQQAIYKAQTGGAQPHIHAKDLNPIVVSIPPIPEQIAIATVLSDMDAELATLEQRLEKTCTLKQGMMQELLTGKTRLL